MNLPDVIRFFKTRDDYGWMTNFAAYPIELDGRRWPTVEHYYQAQKHVGQNTQLVEAIYRSSTPKEAVILGRGTPSRANWDGIKVSVIEKAVLAKFQQHPHLKQQLLQTGTRQIIEASPKDTFWGSGSSGRGANHLGKILMRVRELLKAQDQEFQ